MKNEKYGKKRRTKLLFSKWFSERGHSRNGKWKSKHVASLSQPPPLMCACSFSISFVRSARIWKMKQTEKKGAPSEYFSKWFSERGQTRNEKWKSKHVASLSQPPPLMCACSFSISSVRSARKWKLKIWKKRRTKQILFKNDFQNEATLVMKN